jgi:hypothetical protein
VLHATVCELSPGHTAPPFWGAGLLQVRVWLSVPPPHVAEHVPLTHADQLPSTAAGFEFTLSIHREFQRPSQLHVVTWGERARVDVA